MRLLRCKENGASFDQYSDSICNRDMRQTKIRKLQEHCKSLPTGLQTMYRSEKKRTDIGHLTPLSTW